MSSESDGGGSDGSKDSTDLTWESSAGSVVEGVGLLRFSDGRHVDVAVLPCSHGRLLIDQSRPSKRMSAVKLADDMRTDYGLFHSLLPRSPWQRYVSA